MHTFRDRIAHTHSRRSASRVHHCQRKYRWRTPLLIPFAVVAVVAFALPSMLLAAKPKAKAAPVPSAGPLAPPLILTEIRAIDASNSTGAAVDGIAGATLLRTLFPAYPGDGSGEEIVNESTRANARTVSNSVCLQSGDMPNSRDLSDFTWAWGQFLDHDLDLSHGGSHNGTANIAILDGADPLGPSPIPFTRSDFATGTGTSGTPRQQINSITAFIDASNLYGSDSVRAAALRSFVNGKLRTGDNDLLPFNDVGLDNAGGLSPTLFLAGDIRANENVVLSSIHTIFLREHNRVADLIRLQQPGASDEEIYQLARKVLAAEMQMITYREFLPALLGDAAPNLSRIHYDSTVSPGIANSFSTAFYRFGHSLLSPNLQLVNEKGRSKGSVPLQGAFFNPSLLSDHPENINLLLGGLGTQICQEVDTRVVEDVRSFLFGPPGAGGLDLAALNIQRGRDHGLPDYNSFRVAFGLSAVTGFEEITANTTMAAGLETTYGSVDNIDLWVGALAEDHVSGASVGPLLQAALADQFARLIQGDPLSVLQDTDLIQPLVASVVNLELTSLADIVRANTTVRSLPLNPFYADEPIESDVTLHYSRAANRVLLTGNRDNNNVAVIRLTDTTMLIVGMRGTRINGSKYQTVWTGRDPHLTVDLGVGNDDLKLLLLDLGNVCISMGAGKDSLKVVRCRAKDSVVDMGDDQKDKSRGDLKIATQ